MNYLNAPVKPELNKKVTSDFNDYSTGQHTSINTYSHGTNANFGDVANNAV
jgi:hypothetical protein